MRITQDLITINRIAIMNRKLIKQCIVGALILISCGNNKKSSDSNTCADLLPVDNESIGLIRASEVRTFAGESLYEYIDGGAEIYHKYKFIEVATADYKLDDTEMTADIYRFENDDYAYGLYATHRPPEPDFIALGSEANKSDLSVDFVKDRYYVKVIGFSENKQTAENVVVLAGEIDSLLPGDDYLPRTFSLFPQGRPLAATDMMYADSFLGQQFLAEFFTRKYLVVNDTLTLFITEKDAETKFNLWFESASLEGMAEPGPEELPFDDGLVLVMDNVYYGKIIAGVKDGRLLGIINYADNKSGLLTDWLESLP